MATILFLIVWTILGPTEKCATAVEKKMFFETSSVQAAGLCQEEELLSHPPELLQLGKTDNTKSLVRMESN